MIAYIDDNPECLSVTKDLFKSHGIDLQIFDSPLSFPFHKIKEYKIIISDYDMPINGQEFLNHLINQKHLKTILYSGKIQNICYSKSLQVDSFLYKPFDNKKLISTVKLFLKTQK